MKFSGLIMRALTVIPFLTVSHGIAQMHSADEPAVVSSVNLERYAGLWYEIAKIPNFFQKKCAQNTTAEYTLRKDGKIDVINRCQRADGEYETARGLAKIADTVTGARLKVSFFSLLGFRPFWGDYWIIGLDEDYQWAVVGDPSRKYGWILSRTSRLSEEARAGIDKILIAQGYDPERFEDTVHKID